MPENFKHAIEGIAWSFRNHRNFRIFTAVSLFVFVLAGFLRVSSFEFIILVFTITLGFVAEMLNTAIEEVTNLVTIKWAKQAKIAKDVAAGMVLLTAVGAGIVGSIVFIPYLRALW
ncbi:diacylglycerol kinase family protein [Candidatus Roizmanbacteria bacterium]|nr:diacylglycerol kinase family protein [Candidatus Roizmanbacteria bacterium]